MAELTIRNLKCQVADRNGNTQIQWEPAVFQKSPGMESLYNWGRGLFHLLTGEA